MAFWFWGAMARSPACPRMRRWMWRSSSALTARPAHKLRARIETKGRDGTGLVFTDADIDTYAALLNLNHDDGELPRA